MDDDIGLVTQARPPPDSSLIESRTDVDQVLASKLFVPPPTATLLDRPRLLARLGEGLRCPLTLIAAPPGWGKTTLLSAWAAAVQDFLLRTSILDRMCASLCQALGEDAAAPADAQRQLEQLDRANLFLIPLDGERRWYRYHHLFADLLRARLQQDRPDDVGRLHRRASAWFERADLVAEALHHALKARDFVRAADLLEATADPLWVHGHMATLRAWLAQVPTEVLRGRPRLLVAQAWAQFLVASHPSGPIEAILHDAEAALAAGDTAATDSAARVEQARLAGRILVIRASLSSWQRDTRQTIALSRAALGQLGSDDLIWRAVALTDLGMAYALRGEVVAATRALTEATHLSPAAASYYTLGARMWLAQLHVIRGELRDASELYHQLLDEAIQQGMEHLPCVWQA